MCHWNILRLVRITAVALCVAVAASCIPVREHRLEFFPMSSTVRDSITIRIGVIPGTGRQDSPTTVGGPYDVFIRVSSSGPGFRLYEVTAVTLLGLRDSAVVPLILSPVALSDLFAHTWTTKATAVRLAFQDYDVHALLITGTGASITDTLRVSGKIAKRRLSRWAYWPWSFMS